MANNTIMTAKNTFGDGMLLDFAPDNTQATCLTHALNATLVTMNGNEMSLQNDMGNGRVETAYLPEGYAPVGTCEFGGIIYIVSYNPLTNKSQIGCFPSPERNISSDEIGDSVTTLQETDFLKDNNLTTMNVKKVIVSRSLNPGDKYVIYTTENLINNKNYLSDYGNTDHVHGGFPKILKLHVVSIEDSGKITYLDDSVRWYTSTKTGEPEDYYITTCTQKATQQADIDSYRDLLNSGYSVFQSKVSGKLAILAELESITGFETSYNVYKTETSSDDKGFTYNTYKVFLNFHWSTDNYDINPDKIVLSTSEWVSTGQYRQAKKGDDGKVYIGAEYEGTITIPSSNKSWIITTDYNNIEGYKINKGCTYAYYKSKYTFDKFKESIKESIEGSNTKLDFNTVTQYFNTSNIPEPSEYLIDLCYIQQLSEDSIVYYDKNYTELNPVILPDILVNNHFRNAITKELGDFTIPITQAIDDKTINIDSSKAIYHYIVQPWMCYGALKQYQCEGYIDFSKINSGELNLTQWRYFIGENIANIQLGLDCYEEENMGIKEVVLEFCDHQGVAATYFLRDRTSYSGVFPINASLNQIGTLSNIGSDGKQFYHAGSESEKGEVILDTDGKASHQSDKNDTSSKLYSDDAGVLYSNMLYAVRITIKYCTKDVLGNYNEADESKYKVFYRWLWTNTLLNSYYLTSKDFDNITPQLNLDVTTNYTSNLSNKTVNYQSTGSESGLAAMVQFITGNISAKVDVGLQNTYNTFTLYAGANNENMQNIKVKICVGNKYIDSPTNNTYKNVKGSLIEKPELQPSTNSDYNMPGSSLRDLLIESEGIVSKTDPEMWEKADKYKNMWLLAGDNFSKTDTLTYYNYNYVETTSQCSYKELSLTECYSQDNIKFNIYLLDYSKYFATYGTQTVTVKIIQPLVYTQQDLDKFQLQDNSDCYSSYGSYDNYVVWDLNHKSGLKMKYDGSQRITVYKDQAYPYWLAYKESGGQVLYDWKQLLTLGINQVLQRKYNIVYYSQGWASTNGVSYINYFMAARLNQLSAYTRENIPYYSGDYPDDVNGNNTVDNSKLVRTGIGFCVYVMEDKAGNKRPINLVCNYENELKNQLIGTLSNLYKVSTNEESSTSNILQDITYLNSYTSVYTADILFQVSLNVSSTEDTTKATDVYRPYLLFNGCVYNDYLDKLLKNNSLDKIPSNKLSMNNVNIQIGNILKNIPIQLKINYKEPNTVIPDVSSTYLLKTAVLNGSEESKLITGSFNSNTLYIYKDDTLQPWNQYTPCLDVRSTLVISDKIKVRTNSGIETPSTISFARTNSSGYFVYEDDNLYLADSSVAKDEVRLVTRGSNDNTDPDQILYFTNSREVLVPNRTILKYE